MSPHCAVACSTAGNKTCQQYTVSFQSRLGRRPWIKPFTDEVLTLLPKEGINRLLVCCPSFTADCLETTEEIGMRGVELFKAAGGAELELAPCLNDDDAWVQAVAELLQANGAW